MKKPQLEYLQKLHSRYLAAGVSTPPQLTHHIRAALVNKRRTLLLRSRDEILLSCGKQMADYSFNSGSELPFSLIFQAPVSYLAAQKEHAAAVKDREVRVKKYRATADDLLLSAELEDDADAKVIAIALERAARAAGLIV